MLLRDDLYKTVDNLNLNSLQYSNCVRKCYFRSKYLTDTFYCSKKKENKINKKINKGIV